MKENISRGNVFTRICIVSDSK